MNIIKELLKNSSTILVDVRSPWEYEMDHIPGAKNIPLEELVDKAEEVKNFKSPVILYCRSGNRSGMAVNILKQMGLVDIFNGGGLYDLKNNLN